MPITTRRSFLMIPPAVAALSWFGGSAEGVEALDAPPLQGALHASGAPVKGFRHAQLKGAVTLVHALSSRSAACEEESAMWAGLARHPAFQLAALFVEDDEAGARAFLARHGNPYDAVGFDADGSAARRLGVAAAPTTFVFGPDGRIVHVLRGALTQDYFDGTLLPVIEAASPASAMLASALREETALFG